MVILLCPRECKVMCAFFRQMYAIQTMTIFNTVTQTCVSNWTYQNNLRVQSSKGNVIIQTGSTCFPFTGARFTNDPAWLENHRELDWCNYFQLVIDFSLMSFNRLINTLLWMPRTAINPSLSILSPLSLFPLNVSLYFSLYLCILLFWTVSLLDDGALH